MKSIVLTAIILVLALLSTSFSQSINYNLKKLNQVTVEINDHDLLSNKIAQKLETEIKLKLMSAGIKVVQKEDAKAVLEVTCDAIESNFAEHRIIVMLKLNEKVITERETKPETDAITYFDYSFFTSKQIESAVYNKVMDVMLISFIERYLSSNQ